MNTVICIFLFSEETFSWNLKLTVFEWEHSFSDFIKIKKANYKLCNNNERNNRCLCLQPDIIDVCSLGSTISYLFYKKAYVDIIE